jgi:hypothetical protein
MESVARLVFMIDLAVFALVLVSVPCVLVALMVRRAPVH